MIFGVDGGRAEGVKFTFTQIRLNDDAQRVRVRGFPSSSSNYKPPTYLDCCCFC